MFARIARIALVGIAAFYTLSAQASPIGFYAKFGPIFYLGKDSAKRENLAGFVSGSYQFNPTRIWEVSWTIPATTIKNSNVSSGGADVKNAFTFIDRQVIPLKYYLNIYTQWGVSLKTNLGLHAPFVGVGLSYYHTRALHFDISWRNYEMLRKLKERASPESRKHSIVIGFAYYIKGSGKFR